LVIHGLLRQAGLPTFWSLWSAATSGPAGFKLHSPPPQKTLMLACRKTYLIFSTAVTKEHSCLSLSSESSMRSCNVLAEITCEIN